MNSIEGECAKCHTKFKLIEVKSLNVPNSKKIYGAGMHGGADMVSEAVKKELAKVNQILESILTLLTKIGSQDIVKH